MYSNRDKRFYILIGDENSWNISFRYNLWGFSNESKGLWNTSETGDFLAFYVTTPIKKIIGFGIIQKKFINEDIIWPDEQFFGKSIWKFKSSFKKIYIVNNWEDGIPVPSTIMLNMGRKVISKKVFESFVYDAKKKWNKNIILD